VGDRDRREARQPVGARREDRPVTRSPHAKRIAIPGKELTECASTPDRFHANATPGWFTPNATPDRFHADWLQGFTRVGS
jgi:hypothetical protein